MPPGCLAVFHYVVGYTGFIKGVVCWLRHCIRVPGLTLSMSAMNWFLWLTRLCIHTAVSALFLTSGHQYFRTVGPIGSVIVFQGLQSAQHWRIACVVWLLQSCLVGESGCCTRWLSNHGTLMGCAMCTTHVAVTCVLEFED